MRKEEDLVYRILDTPSDFEWYTKELDVEQRYNHKHVGEPNEYPCGVVSRYWDNINGPSTYYHTFVYLEETTCDKCGHIHKDWPLLSDEIIEELRNG